MSTPFVISYVALWVLVILQALILLGLVRTVHKPGNAELPDVRPEGERLTGQLAPRIDTVDVFGVPVRSDEFEGSLRSVLFVSPNCPDCIVSLDELEGLRIKAPGTVVAVCLGDTEECRLLAEDLKLSVPVIADPDDVLKASFDIVGTPTAVLVSRRGRILQYGRPGRTTADLKSLLHHHSESATADQRP